MENSIADLVKEISDSIFHRSLTTRPFYYDHIVNRVFNYEELPKLLRHPIIRQKDQSIYLFLEVLNSFYKPLEDDSVAVLGSGSGILTEELIKFYPNIKFVIHHYDYSKNMLRQESFSKNKHRVDLSKPIRPEKKYRLILSLGCLRYFSDGLAAFSSNIIQLANKRCCILFGEVDNSLVLNFAYLLNKKFEVHTTSKNGCFFRNTLFYFLLDKYKSDLAFRRQIQSQETLDNDYDKVLINLAGFKQAEYHYCIAQK